MSSNDNSAAEKLIDLPKIAAIVKKNWLVLKGDKLKLVPLIMFPIIMIVLFGYTAGATPKYIGAAIVDYDNTILSHRVQSELYDTDLFSINYLLGSQEEGRKLIDSGKIKILFIIPPDFEKDVNAGKIAYVSIIVDESDPSVAQITKASTKLFIQKLSQQILTSKLNSFTFLAQNIKNTLLAAGKKISMATGGSVYDNKAETSQAAIEMEFRDAQTVAQQTDTDIKNKIQVLGHSISSVLLDPNEIAYAYSQGDIPHYTSVYDILTSSDRQAYIEQQIAVHAEFQIINAHLARVNQKIYANAKNIESAYQNEKQLAINSEKSIMQAKSQVDLLIDNSKKNPSDPVSVSEIEPYGTGRRGLDFLLPNILALIVFQGAVAGLGRAIAGERRDGSLTRVFLTPTSNITIIGGTQLFYVLLETIRSSLIVFVAAALFGVMIKGSIVEVIFIIWIYALGATGVGMILSVISKSQDQYMAMSMLLTLPMMFLGGVFFPIQTMPPVLQGITKALPITYAADALRGVMIKGFTLSQVMPDLVFLAGFGVITVTLSTLIFKRELI